MPGLQLASWGQFFSVWSSSLRMMELRVDSGMAAIRLIVPRDGIGPGYDLVPGERMTQ